MKRNLRAAGLALVAAFAMSAVAVSAAQAKGPAHFTQPNDLEVAFTGVEEGGTASNYLQITGASGPKYHCENVKYEGDMPVQTTTLTVTPHYTKCVSTTTIGTIAATVDLNGCDFVFTAEALLPNNQGATGSVSIDCDPTKTNPTHRFISVTTAFCDTHILEQTLSKGITFTNVANGDVTVDVNINQEITYTETKTSIFGPCTDNHHTKDGSFVSSILVSGYELKGTHHWITKEETPNSTETTLSTVTEGSAIDIDVGAS